MSVLANNRHERFAQELFKGKSQAEAYALAGYKPSEQHASRLASNGKVQARVTELKEKAADQAGVTVTRVVKELARIAFADIRHAVQWGNNLVRVEETNGHGKIGEVRLVVNNEVRFIDSDKIDDDTAAAISEITQSPNGGLKVKLHDKLPALVRLGEHLGMFDGERAEVAPVNLNVSFVDAPPRETYEEWMARRGRELGNGTRTLALVSPARSTD